MNRISAVLLCFIFIPFLGFSQRIPRDSTAKKMSGLSFNVISSRSTGAYDNPDTDLDESTDGICADENGQCTLPAAIEEANNQL
jgi:hypothetical protein